MAVFEKNVEATIPKLRRYARALTRDPEIADDLVQDTLVRALRSKHLFHGDVVHNWLYTILINLNRNRLRALARRPMLSPLEDKDAPNSPEPDADARDIERALSTLADDQRHALLLVVLIVPFFTDALNLMIPKGQHFVTRTAGGFHLS